MRCEIWWTDVAEQLAHFDRRQGADDAGSVRGIDPDRAGRTCTESKTRVERSSRDDDY